MFDGLRTRFEDVFDRLKRRGALSEGDVSAAMREIRIALLEADVALPVVKEFIDTVGAEAVGQEVLRSINPGQMMVKVVNDRLVEMLGASSEGIDLAGRPAGGGDDGRAPGLGQDDHDGEARQAAGEPGPQEGAVGLARRAPSRGAGTAGHPRRPGRTRDPARDPAPDAADDRRSGDGDRAQGGLRRGPAGHRRQARDRRCADGRGGDDRRCRGPPGRPCWSPMR